MKINAFIVGAQKAGTTSLFNYLGLHPDIEIHAHKELPYFRDDEQFVQLDSNELTQKYYPNVLDHGNSFLLAKDVHLMYNLEGLNRLKDYNSGVKVVILLREPIKRAYSAYWYARKRGWEISESFELALDLEDTRSRESWNKWKNNLYIGNSSYSIYISEILRIFTTSDVKILFTEDFSSDPHGVLEELIAWFGLPKHHFPVNLPRENKAGFARSEGFSRFLNQVKSISWVKQIWRRLIPSQIGLRLIHGVKSLNDKEGSIPPIKDETKKSLQEKFEFENKTLEGLIGRIHSSWNK